MTDVTKDLEVISKAKEMLKLLADVLLTVDAEGKLYLLQSNIHDVENALLVFNSVLGNYSIGKMLADKVTEEQGIEIAKVNGAKLRQLVKDWTGLDPVNFYNDEGIKDKDGQADEKPAGND